MKRCFNSLLFLLAIMLLGTVDSKVQAQELEDVPTDKLAQTGLKFLNFSVDPRAASLANALTAQDVGSSVSMFYNPATMAHMTGQVDVFFGHSQWIADIDYNAASVAFRPADGMYGVFGLTVLAVDYGEFIGTIRAPGEVSGGRGYVETGNFSPTAFSVGLGYARSLTDRFSVGGVAKWAKEDIGSVAMETPESWGDGQSINIGDTNPADFSKATVAFDFGVVYRTGFRSLNIAMRARNFSRDLMYESNPFELPLTFQIGAAMNMVDLTQMDANMHSFVLSVDAERHRDYHEQLRIGGEYMFLNTLALRAGYAYPTDEQGVNFGAGINLGSGDFRIAADYAYTQFGLFGGVNQLGVKLGF